MRMSFLLLLLMILSPVGGCGNDAPSTSEANRAAASIPPLDDQLATIFRLIEQDETGAARIRLRNWMDANGEDARALFLFGLAYQKEKRYAPAAEWFDRSAEALPVYPPAWHFLGWSRYYLGEPRLSESAFLRHLELTPDEADSAYGLGLVMLDDGRIDEAKHRFEQSIELLGVGGIRQEQLAKALFRLAQIEELRGDDVEARRLLELSLEASDRVEEAWFRLIHICRRLGDESAAQQARARHDELATQFPHGVEP